MTTIARDSLMTLEAYSKIRKASRADAIAAFFAVTIAVCGFLFFVSQQGA